MNNKEMSLYGKLECRTRGYAHLIGQMLGYIDWTEFRVKLTDDERRRIKDDVKRFRARFDEINKGRA